MVSTVMSCIKCGSTDHGKAWHSDSYDCGFTSRNRRGVDKALFQVEHLHYHCRGCSFEWATKELAPEALVVKWSDTYTWTEVGGFEGKVSVELQAHKHRRAGEMVNTIHRRKDDPL